MVGQELLDTYANLIIQFGAANGKPPQPGKTIFLGVPDCALPILNPLVKATLQAECFPLIHIEPQSAKSTLLQYGSMEQLEHAHKKLNQARVNSTDYFVRILAEADLRAASTFDSRKVGALNSAARDFSVKLFDKENKGKLTWTLAVYGTPAMAKEAGLSIGEYWDEIVRGCYLDAQDPVKEWLRIVGEIRATAQALTAMKISKVQVEAEDTDLTVHIGENRRWLAGTGRNLPSYEVFTSPDWRGTSGRISFSQPLYNCGTVVKGISLEFKHGKVVKATAQEGQASLDEMLRADNMDKLGEYSLTDKRHSRITKFMAETLFDENTGGAYGNTHIALGLSFPNTFVGEPTQMNLQTAGFNNSKDHVDIITTTDRVVTATLSDGAKKVIYRDGMFQV